MNNTKLLDDLRRHLIDAFKDTIDSIVLFGSRVTGNDSDHSDYDILVIVNGDYTWEMERDILAVCYEMDLKYDIITDVKVLSKKELDSIRGRQPYIQNAIKQGITVSMT